MTSATLHLPTSAPTSTARGRSADRSPTAIRNQVAGRSNGHRAPSRRVSVVTAAVGSLAGLTMALLGPMATPSERPAPSVIHRRPTATRI